jgi:hypothetical protein
MVADEAPRLFAIVQEYGERVDGRIAARGIAFDNHAEVASVARGVRGSLRTSEVALRLFNRGSRHSVTTCCWADTTSPRCATWPATRPTR